MLFLFEFCTSTQASRGNEWILENCPILFLFRHAEAELLPFGQELKWEPICVSVDLHFKSYCWDYGARVWFLPLAVNRICVNHIMTIILIGFIYNSASCNFS